MIELINLESSGCVSGGVVTFSCIPFILQNVVNFLVGFASIVAVFMLVFAGFKMAWARGDMQKVADARKIIIFTLIGLFLVYASFVLVNILATSTGVTQLAPKP
ncbi:MAG: hypothetical protein COU27_01600 [Candidatus Levybacteria bacterium CG10_big_fil_rev_8_21_14_0_10_36_7]|nr:MAG: hypothetical protein COU27_01600 [Candidatus Levybacteria bacterium CG10_big_fil_rev_8_21_14_0_10_36_7]